MPSLKLWAFQKTESNTIKTVVYADATSFSSKEQFHSKWNMLYPWGAEHNGSAKMFPENVNVKNGVLTIKSEYNQGADDGTSKHNPYLKINFRSGAVHLKEQIVVNDSLPYWEISADFKAPIAYGSWPAFWITGANSWPPEIDILEFKGNTTCLQNTVTGPDWRNTIWTTETTTVTDAHTKWHNYKLIIKKIDSINTEVLMFIDDELKSKEVKDFTNKPFWLIINMQMEGASGRTNENAIVKKEPQYFYTKNIYVAGKTKIKP
ncbi:glycoside hydrolase family 16 protein [Neotamlana nanhaiensis]|uniref:glycoside hydrolase family 16 protein n=1 Tax=Neotamlana nanhaiensis TaxID=1382798 RepID=UPI00069A1717|nr:family 16 glycosylhydrolase [Tamlana nanhaiensis]